MKTSIGLIVLLLIILTTNSACLKQDSTEAVVRVDQAMRAPTFFGQIQALLIADQQFDSSRAKLNLVALFLQTGNYDQAAHYCGELKDKVWTLPADQQYLYYLNFAELNLRTNQFEAAERAGAEALLRNQADPRGAVFTKLKAQYRRDLKADALLGLTSLWAKRQADFSYEDALVFLNLIIADKQWAKAKEVASYIDQTFGYVPGIGAIQAIVAQELKDYSAAVLGLVKDLDAQLATGVLLNAQVTQSLQKLSDDATKFIADQTVRGQIQSLIEGFRIYFKGDYASALAILKPKIGQVADNYSQFLLAYMAIRTGKVELSDLSRYLKYEKAMKNHPNFYYGLWLGMKQGAGKYDLASAGPVLETIINSTAKNYSNQARAELARLLDIPVGDSNLLLSASEIDALASRIAGFGELRYLDRLTDLVSLPSSSYSDYGLRTITALAQSTPVRDYLASHFHQYAKPVQRRLAELGLSS